MACRPRGPQPKVGTSQVQGIGSTTLIAEGGEKWRILRREYLIPWGGWLLAGMLGVILVFHLIRKAPERFDTSSGEWIQRFPEYDRILHWFMAGTFIFLALTGLILLLGRFLLLPVWCKYSNELYDIVIRQYYGQSVRAMASVLQPFHLLVIALAGWLNRQQQTVTGYLIEEDRVLKEQLEGQRLRFTCATISFGRD